MSEREGHRYDKKLIKCRSIDDPYECRDEQFCVWDDLVKNRSGTNTNCDMHQDYMGEREFYYE